MKFQYIVIGFLAWATTVLPLGFHPTATLLSHFFAALGPLTLLWGSQLSNARTQLLRVPIFLGTCIGVWATFPHTIEPIPFFKILSGSIAWMAFTWTVATPNEWIDASVPSFQRVAIGIMMVFTLVLQVIPHWVRSTGPLVFFQMMAVFATIVLLSPLSRLIFKNDHRQ